MTDNPYTHLPDRSFWRRAVAQVPAPDVDPAGDFDLRIGTDTKVATAGSCFAQHIARHLSNSGFHYYVAEQGHPILSAAVRSEQNYGLYSCRYGNIYTARQLLQLIQRAYGEFAPVEDVWETAPGVIVDPFRPTTQHGGFASEGEMRLDRAQHLAAVRRMFETLDVFVFTLGLTEAWRSRADGAVFPLCPGVQGGTFDPERHEYYNQPVEDVIADLTEFHDKLLSVNRRAQVILTVSPVPLVATAEPGQHVLAATTYSKSVLRIAAETMRRQFANVHYFPAYEVVTGAYNRGAYFADDLRSVREEGVAHVMRLFMEHASDKSERTPTKSAAAPSNDRYREMSEQLVEVECDEIALDAR
jgi:hypothetical protein